MLKTKEIEMFKLTKTVKICIAYIVFAVVSSLFGYFLEKELGKDMFVLHSAVISTMFIFGAFFSCLESGDR